MVKLIDIKITLVVDQKKSCSGNMDHLGAILVPQSCISLWLWINSKNFSKFYILKGAYMRDTWVNCFFLKNPVSRKWATFTVIWEETFS